MKIMKVLSILSIVAMLVSVGVPVFAAPSTIGNVSISPNTTGDTIKTITKFGNSIMGIIQVVGIVIAVVILMIIGIKYMMGSAEEKAEYKKTMIPYIVGAILIFAASTIANVAYTFATGITA